MTGHSSKANDDGGTAAGMASEAGGGELRKLLTKEQEAELRELRTRVHELLARINRDYARLQFNTVIAACRQAGLDEPEL